MASSVFDRKFPDNSNSLFQAGFKLAKAMKILVTGATGFIGSSLCYSLASAGHEVLALGRNRESKREFDHPGIQFVQGDITEQSDMLSAMKQSEACYHLAALAKPWAQRREQFAETNTHGTSVVFAAALASNIKRVVFTSTASVFGPASADSPVNENSPTHSLLDSEYERTKQACESVVEEFQQNGLDIVTVYPSRVYGPGVQSQSNSLTDIFRKFDEAKWRLVPGDGNSVGNYVFVDDVVAALGSAMTKSRPNQRYLIGGENLSFHQIVTHLQAATGNHHRLFHVPSTVLRMLANLQLAKATLIGTPPSITPAFVAKYLKNWYIDSSKINKELGVIPTPFADGLAHTLAWIRKRAN